MSHTGATGFTYDAAYNPTQFSYFSGSADATLGLPVNGDNQINTGGFTFDGAGDPTTFVGSAMSFDPEDRLLSVSGANPFTAAYDGDGLRAVKTATLAGFTQTTYFVYDGDTPVVEETWSGTSATFVALNGWTADGWRARNIPAEGHATDFIYDPQENRLRAERTYWRFGDTR